MSGGIASEVRDISGGGESAVVEAGEINASYGIGVIGNRCGFINRAAAIGDGDGDGLSVFYT